jgi:DNA-binding MarR family transcriptional regulator
MYLLDRWQVCNIANVMEDRPTLALAFSGHTAAAQIRRALAAYGFKPGHGNVLILLSDQGATSQQSLAEALAIDPSVLVAVLNDLEVEGLIERRRDPADRRRHIVEITPHGKSRVADFEAALAAVEAVLFADLDAGEIATLGGLLARVRTQADESSCIEG